MVRSLSLFLVAASFSLLTNSVLRIYSSPSILGAATNLTTTVTYPLLEGWNLVHFPFSPDSFATASELVKAVAQSGGYVTTIATWQDGHWQEYIQRGADVYSADLPILPGQAYFLRSHRQFDWSVTGTLVTPPSVSLNPGWNTIGLFPQGEQTAATALETLQAKELDRWLSGLWEPFVFDTQAYGYNFPISDREGYMIKL